ncbi:MAG: MerC domain-containing protein [Gemmatimonadaceae bacterium]
MSGRRLPTLDGGAAHVVGGAGVLACVLCCVSVPAIVTGLSALGLGFLRNDRLIFPAESLFAILVVWTLLRSRTLHRQSAPLIVGMIALAILFFGLETSGPMSTVGALTGALGAATVMFWDWRLDRHCAT